VWSFEGGVPRELPVSLGQLTYPAADLSEQISTAGKEASGTGNMKFSMNGALTIGTLDGANIEIREGGAENFFLFGLSAEEVSVKSRIQPVGLLQYQRGARQVIDSIASGCFSSGNPDLFRPIVESLLHRDEYLHLADYQSYVDCQSRSPQPTETRRGGPNVDSQRGRMGKFSSDRTIQDIARNLES